MPSLSEAATEFSVMGPYAKDDFMVAICKVIESLTEARVAASNHIETLNLRIEELESQVAALAPPKSAGPVLRQHQWVSLMDNSVYCMRCCLVKQNESDLPAEGM